MCPNASDILLSVLAILFPPLAVWVKRGLCSAESLINIALCCLGFLPGLLHAWYIIASTPDAYEYERVVDIEAPLTDPRGPMPAGGHAGGIAGANTSYYYVRTSGNGPVEQFGAGSTVPQQVAHQGYGSMGGGQAVGGASAKGGAPSIEVPPTYDDAIKGDNKVQRS